jgi:hypothetical protein
VVICGQQFAVISSAGCADHPYKNDFNLDIKNARNNVPEYEITYPKIFADFKPSTKPKWPPRLKRKTCCCGE